MEQLRLEEMVARMMALGIVSFIHSFIHQSKSESDVGLGWNTAVQENAYSPCPHGADLLWGEKDNKQEKQ